MAEQIREGSSQSYGVVVERDVMVVARDGVRLATDIYRQALAAAAGGVLPAPGRFPAIVERTPYDLGRLPRNRPNAAIPRLAAQPRRRPRPLRVLFQAGFSETDVEVCTKLRRCQDFDR